MPTGAAADQAAQHKTKTEPHKDDDRGPGSLAGNLTKDPDLRFTPAGRAVTNLRVAVSSRVRDDITGEWKDGETAYYDIVAWGQLAENVCESLEKGDRIVAEGRWTSNTWTDKEGTVQERIILNARDLGPSMIFRCARPIRPSRQK